LKFGCLRYGILRLRYGTGMFVEAFVLSFHFDAWMQAALKACGEGVTQMAHAEGQNTHVTQAKHGGHITSRSFVNPDRGLPDVRDLMAGKMSDANLKNNLGMLNSALYNSMIAPLLVLPISGFLWYQGKPRLILVVEFANRTLWMHKWWTVPSPR
jgi:hypothetical protein